MVETRGFRPDIVILMRDLEFNTILVLLYNTIFYCTKLYYTIDNTILILQLLFNTMLKCYIDTTIQYYATILDYF